MTAHLIMTNRTIHAIGRHINDTLTNGIMVFLSFQSGESFKANYQLSTGTNEPSFIVEQLYNDVFNQ